MSATETCTLTSTQAIKSRTFSSGNASERDSGDTSNRSAGRTGTRGQGESSTDKNLSTIHASDAYETERTDDGMDGAGGAGTDAAPATASPAGGVTTWVRRVLRKFSPVSVKTSIARLFGYGEKKGRNGGEPGSASGSESGGGSRAMRLRSVRSWRGRKSNGRQKSNRGTRKKRGWRVRMPWSLARRERPAPLLIGGSTEEYVRE